MIGVGAGTLSYTSRRSGVGHELAAWTSPPASASKVVEVVTPMIPFAEVAVSSGIDFNRVSGAFGDKLTPETMSGAGGFFDFDGDGDQDVVLVHGGHWPEDPGKKPLSVIRVYRNDGRGHFEDATKALGLEGLSFIAAGGLAAGDADGDGDVDLFVAGLDRNYLFENREGKRFVDVAAAPIAEARFSSASAFFDHDGDGDLDLLVGRYVKWNREINAALQTKFPGGLTGYAPAPKMAGEPIALYRNDGGFAFVDVSEESGVVIRDRSGFVGRVLGFATIDFDRDGDVDVLAASDELRHLVLVNDGKGKFTERGREMGFALAPNGEPTSGMGIDAAYYRNDDALAVAISNFYREPSSLYVLERPDDTSFEDMTVAEGFGAPTYEHLSWGLFFFDADLDGRQDIFQANGGIDDVFEKLSFRVAGYAAEVRRHSFRMPTQLFWNCGDACGQTFVELPKERVGDLVQSMVARGAAYGDVDGDGDLDILVVAWNGPAMLLRNDQATGNHYLRVRLEGKPPNTDAIGARVELRAGGVTQRRHIQPSRSYFSLAELPATFGLGRGSSVDSIEVHWPDGTSQRVAPVERVDQTLTIRHPSAGPMRSPPGAAEAPPSPSPTP